MREGKAAGIVLIVANVILVVLCIVWYIQSDRTAPKFLLETADVIYMPGEDGNKLITGISAFDNRDGDVTDRIVIEKITEKREENTAVVYYAVADSAGNVSKLSKLFYADYPEEQDETYEEDGSGPEELQEDDAYSGGDETQEEDSGEETTDGAEEDEGNSEEADEAGNDVEEPQDAGEEEPEERGDAGQENETAPEVQQEETEINAGAPELVLGTDEVAIQAGTNPPWTEIITTLRDDKDDYATLYYNLQVSQYNRSRPGSYPVTVYVEDSDGNRSEEWPVTIIVR